MPPAAVTLTPVAEQEFPMLRDLADAIWRQHYGETTSTKQIDSMLAGRMSDDALRNYVQTPDRWLEVLRASGTPVGFRAFETAVMPGDGSHPATMKLGQLYVLASHRGMGLGRLMLGHVEDRARDLGKTVLWLQVNKKNTGAIGFYEAAGFEVVREAVFDIGSGFVNDDYVMAKRLAANRYRLESGKVAWLTDNEAHDTAIQLAPEPRSGTRVTLTFVPGKVFGLADVFQRWTDPDTLAFDRTRVIARRRTAQQFENACERASGSAIEGYPSRVSGP